MRRRKFIETGMSAAFGAAMIHSSAKADRNVQLASYSAGSGETRNFNDALPFLDDLQRRCYQFFIDTAHPTTGFVADRASADGNWISDHSSSAACGFALAGHSMAAEAGWTSRGEAADRTRQLLRSLVDIAQHEHGFLYHFFERSDGRRSMRCEASSIDTALLIAGANCASTTFADDTAIVELSNELYRRIDWNFLLGDNLLMYMGYTPEGGIIPYQWDSYSELIVLVLLAIGAPENAIPPAAWHAWRREPVFSIDGNEFISYPPLFVHQYPMAFFDFREYRSAEGRNYWSNAIHAHRAHIAFLTELGKRHPERMGHYSYDLWGLTSSDSATGYRDWGGPYQPDRFEPDRGIDGTIVPSAAAGALPIVPDAALHTLQTQRAQFGDRVYGRYGFVNAFNPATGWIGADVIGIDTGITLLMAENLVSGGVWKAFMTHPSATRALELSGFAKVGRAS